MPRVSSTPTRGISSNEVTQSPLAARSSPNNETAAPGSRTATKAVARDFSDGYSLMQAAVITPSVPSAPRNSDFDVVAGVVLAQAREGVHDAPVGEHHFEPQHEFARHAVVDDIEPAGVGGEVAAEHAAAFAAETQG